MISFIVPAHNEEFWIGGCLDNIRTAMDNVAERYEVIVVDDASTDSTSRIAQEMGVRTLRVDLRKISAVRGPHYDSPWVRDLLYGRRAQASRKPAKEIGGDGVPPS